MHSCKCPPHFVLYQRPCVELQETVWPFVLAMEIIFIIGTFSTLNVRIPVACTHGHPGDGDGSQPAREAARESVSFLSPLEHPVVADGPTDLPNNLAALACRLESAKQSSRTRLKTVTPPGYLAASAALTR